MDKKSNENIVCTYCSETAVKDTNPPVCEFHQTLRKTAGEHEPATLKELENTNIPW